MDKTILVLSIVVVCIIGIGTGVSLGAIQVGEMSSNIQHVFSRISNNLLSTSTFNTSPPNEVANILQKASIGFGFSVIPVDPDKIVNSSDEYLINAVSECQFHSETSINSKTCVVCTLEDESEDILASGRVDLPKYVASDSIPIEITKISFEGANDVTNVERVKIQVCQDGQGCTPGFWKNHLGQWEKYKPSDKFRTIFGISPSESFTIKSGNKNLSNPTLLEALNAQGGGINALSRHAVAALLNSVSHISFPMSEEQVLVAFHDAFSSKKYEKTKDLFAQANELGCPFGKDECKPSPVPMCEPKGITTYSVDSAGDVTVITTQSRDVNDNSYGVNSINWGSKVHKFSDLTNSDKMEFRFTDKNGKTILDFYSDYISTSTNTISGYSSLGPNGGDGSMIVGSSSMVLGWDSSMAQNLNTHGYFVGKVQNPPPSGVLVPNLLIDSPKTISNTSYTPAVGSPFTAWNFDDVYIVKISHLAFPGGFVAGGYKVTNPDFHNSPEKVCVTSVSSQWSSPPSDECKDNKKYEGKPKK